MLNYRVVLKETTRVKMMSKPVSVIVPTYCGSQTLTELVTRIVQSDWWTPESEVLLVDDGNTDNTWSVIRSISTENHQVQGLRLSRNFGQHAALLAGIRHAQHDICLTLDDDLQNPPEEATKLLHALSGSDVVYGVPREKQHSRMRTVTTRVSKAFLRYALGYSHATNISSFRAFRTSLRNGFAENLGPGVSIDSLLNWSTSQFGVVVVEHHERRQGRSNYGVRGLIRFMTDLATGYSVRPLRAAMGLGLTIIATGFATLVWVLIRALLSGSPVPGFPFLVVLISVFSGTQLVILGVLGQYIGHMHFRVMNRPTYVISDNTRVLSHE